jgi:uncharacterized membrane protein
VAFIRKQITMALTIAYPIATHIAIVNGRQDIAVLIFGLMAGLFFVNQRSQSQNIRNNRVMVVSGIGLIVLTLYIFSRESVESVSFIIYLPPIYLLSFFLLVFAKTLFPGREPLITIISRMVFQDNRPGIESYTRQLTWVWAYFLAFLLLETIGLTFFAPLEVWSLFTNVLNYVFIILFFVLEFMYRFFRFGNRYSVSYCLKKLAQLPSNQIFKF